MFVEHKEQGEVRELDKASKLLLKAADYIEKHGWCQNGLETSDGRVCMIGSIHAVADPSLGTWEGEKQEAYQRLYKHFDRSEPAAWNDMPGRAAEEVVSVMRAVALGL